MASVEDRAHYRRGWDASVRYGRNDNPRKRSALEAADMRGEPRAWYLGYEDHACDRPKWTALTPRQPEGVDQDEGVDQRDWFRAQLSTADRMAYDLGADEAEHNAEVHGITAKLAFAYFCDAVRELGPSSEEAPNRHALYWHGCSDRLTELEKRQLAARDDNAWRDIPGLALSPRHPQHPDSALPAGDGWRPDDVDTQRECVTLVAAEPSTGPERSYSLTFNDRSGETITEVASRTRAFIRLRRMVAKRGSVVGYTNDMLGEFLLDADHGQTIVIPRNDLPLYGPHLCPDGCGIALMAPTAPGEAGDDSWYCPGCAQPWTLDLTTRTL